MNQRRAPTSLLISGSYSGKFRDVIVSDLREFAQSAKFSFRMFSLKDTVYPLIFRRGKFLRRSVILEVDWLAS